MNEIATDATYDLEELADLEGIRRLKARYCHLMDRQQWEQWAQLYTPDAELSIEGVGRFVGGAEIARFAQDSLNGIKTSHQATTPDIELTGKKTARATWTVEFAQEGGRLRGYGFYQDELEKRDGHWLFRSVELVTSWTEGSTLAEPDPA